MKKQVLIADTNTAGALILAYLGNPEKTADVSIARTYVAAKILLENPYDIVGIVAPIPLDVDKESDNYHNEIARVVKEKNPHAFIIGLKDFGEGHFSDDFNESYAWGLKNIRNFYDIIEMEIGK